MIKSIVIIGGGTAGWMAASALAKTFGKSYSLRLVESEEIGIVGVGEATVPHLSYFNKSLEIDEAEFIRETKGTFKLGIQFKDWARLGDTYIHGFGTLGHDLASVPFHQYWLRARSSGRAEELGAYSLNTAAAPLGKFMVSATDAPKGSPLAEVAYAYHFDAGLYAQYLRRYAEARGVVRTEGKVREVRLRPADGHVESVVLHSGEVIAGDLFIDCSGFRGLLIEEALHTGYEDWSHFLPCDSALAVPCEKVGPPTPYTRSTARTAGWQWRIPLQHRTGNGHVYARKFMSDDEAAAILLKNLDGKALAEPRQLRFTTGMRRKMWNKNVLAVGLAGGFMEPLESTSIYLIQSAIGRLVLMFPTDEITPVLVDRYNEIAALEYERIRDFLIMHYCATERDDSPFWNYCRTMELPESLRATIALFRDAGRFFRRGDEMFGHVSWVEVMIGQRIFPQGWHPMVNQMSDADLHTFVDHVKSVIDGCVGAMPMHQQFIDRHCKAPGT